MSITLYQVDAFSATPFGGNPAAVALLGSAATERWMQEVAREMNLSETAYLAPCDDGSFDLRWFTPEAEVDLCGHATLASAHVLWETGALQHASQARFNTASGPLQARREEEWIALDFPSQPARPEEQPAALESALGTVPVYLGKSRLDYLAELASEQTLRALNPDFAALKALGHRGVIVTCRSESADYDFVSRYFAPSVGIDEDPVTGSAHCTLGPYWSERLGGDELVGYQASQRGGVVRVRVSGDRTLLFGQAVTVARIELLTP